ncbi:hypothetical protein A0H81_14708 [Grifola frondosa]|uniref:Uncharacterized protein n=1 Tax=Grifola frondosa TaxID=5627 RepID=A0A1C7LKL4_GRIFR|nr:hypothetical protein A0H81_14708 [Grifola frondosa]
MQSPPPSADCLLGSGGAENAAGFDDQLSPIPTPIACGELTIRGAITEEKPVPAGKFDVNVGRRLPAYVEGCEDLWKVDVEKSCGEYSRDESRIPPSRTPSLILSRIASLEM